MFKTILVPTDGSGLSKVAEDAAIEFARINGATLVALAVAEPTPEGAAGTRFIGEPSLDPRELLAAAQSRVQILVNRARHADIPCQCTIALSYHPYQEILKAASDFHCDVIFMASHGRRGIKKILLGSETQKVLANTTLPVMVFR
jgi:nucleotide-binding universal stress UspA family protein